jgi:hypothetical protein
MQDYSCEFLELSIRVPVGEFDKSAFLEDVKETSRDDSIENLYIWSFGSRDNPSKQHAHIVVDLRGEKQVRLALTYHAIDGDVKDVRPPFLEDRAAWLGGFVKVDTIEAGARTSFRFGNDYDPVIGLPFPLLVPVKELSGTKVIGVALELPIAIGLSDVIVQKDKDETIVLASYKRAVKLKEFDLNTELERTSASIKILMNRVKSHK